MAKKEICLSFFSIKDNTISKYVILKKSLRCGAFKFYPIATTYQTISK